jgi:GNAT superfamily N-acetyltransferase
VESVRVAQEDDLDALERLAALAADELGAERGGPLWQQLHGRVEPLAATLRADLAEAADGVGVVLLGTFADAPAGYAVAHRELLPDTTSIAVVTDVYVEPGFRGVGLGEALMDALLTWARETGCRGIDSLALPGMRHSKNFFERFGLTARAILVHKDLRDDGP